LLPWLLTVGSYFVSSLHGCHGDEKDAIIESIEWPKSGVIMIDASAMYTMFIQPVHMYCLRTDIQTQVGDRARARPHAQAFHPHGKRRHLGVTQAVAPFDLLIKVCAGVKKVLTVTIYTSAIIKHCSISGITGHRHSLVSH